MTYPTEFAVKENRCSMLERWHENIVSLTEDNRLNIITMSDVFGGNKVEGKSNFVLQKSISD